MDLENGKIPNNYKKIQDYIKKAVNNDKDILYPIEYDYKHWQ